MGKLQRVSVIIDGSNLYHRLKESMDRGNKLLNFNYESFTKWLVGDREIVAKKYYLGVVRASPDDLRAQEMRKAQQQLFSKLRKTGYKIVYGYLLNTPDGYHEKGVDVYMATDILIGAYEDLYDTVILVSSDTDLLPAIDKVRSMGKKVEYVGFGHKPSLALITHSDIRRLLTAQDLRQFISQ